MRRHTPRCSQSGGGEKPLMPMSEQGTHSSTLQFATHWPVCSALIVRASGGCPQGSSVVSLLEDTPTYLARNLSPLIRPLSSLSQAPFPTQHPNESFWGAQNALLP